MDSAGSNALPNPFNLDGNGNGWFYAAAGLYTVVIIGSTLAYPCILIDQMLVASSGISLSLEYNGNPSASQSLLNLVQGGSIVITNSAGATTITGTAAPITFKINNTNLSSQTTANFTNGAGMTITDGGGGEVVFACTTGSAFQVNAAPLSSQATVNFQNGLGIVISNPSAGNIMVSGTPVYIVGSATPLTAPSIQFGAATLSAGTVTVTLPVGYTTINTYVATATAQGVGSAYPLTVSNLTGSTFAIACNGPNANVVSVAVNSFGSPATWFVTVTCDQNFVSGMSVTFSGLTYATFLNGVTLTIDSCNGSTFVCEYDAYMGGPYGPTDDTGSIFSVWSAAGNVSWTAVGN